jgi:hypothetical protein
MSKELQLISTGRAAAMLGMSEGTLRYWRCAQIGPPYHRIGGRVRYDLDDLRTFADAGRQVPSVRASVETTLGAL